MEPETLELSLNKPVVFAVTIFLCVAIAKLSRWLKARLYEYIPFILFLLAWEYFVRWEVLSEHRLAAWISYAHSLCTLFLSYVRAFMNMFIQQHQSHVHPEQQQQQEEIPHWFSR